MRRRSVSLCLLVLACLAALLTAGQAPASAATLTYPTDCNGALTLQACIDGAPSGATVRVNTSTPIDEFVVIEKSLTLVGVSAPAPTIVGVAVVATDSAGPSGMQMSVSNFKMTLQAVARTISGGGHAIELSDLRVKTGSLRTGIEVTMQASGEISIKDSVVTGFNGQSDGININLLHPSGNASVYVSGNQVSAGNKTSGSGIGIFSAHGGSGRVDVMNNSVFDVADCICGVNAGILVYSNATADDDINIVGNSISRSATNGINLIDGESGTDQLSVDLFNNNITKSAFRAVMTETPGTDQITLREGYNNLYRNKIRSELDGIVSKTNTSANPRFLDERNGDLRIKPSSPLVDSGLTCSPGGVANPDARGFHRLSSESVDIGAFEASSSPSNGGIALRGGSGPDVLFGTKGDDILCSYGAGDLVRGRGGDDYIDGGGGNDVLKGEEGRDNLRGREGRDMGYGGRGADSVGGGDGGDFCLSVKDNTRGNDTVIGGPGVDFFDADRGDTLVQVERRGCIA